MRQTLWINVYRSGVYHRQGKPNTCNLHGGDLYTSYTDAYRAIEHDKGFIATVTVAADLPAEAYVNPPDCEPTPLSQTARIIMSGQDSPILLPIYNGDSLETSEREARDLPLPWQRPVEAPGSPAKAFKPTHGGYPTYPPAAPVLSRSTALAEFQQFSEEQDHAYCT